jgi:HAD superfamily hydrolase (TIGR01509 family)
MIRGVIFDLDGTLFDGEYDWPAIKQSLGVSRSGGTILGHLQSLPAEERERKERLLREFEERATRNGTLKPGAADLLDSLRERGVKLALVTNNNGSCAETILRRYRLRFDLVQTRESGLFKPSGEALLRAARGIGLDPGEIVAVGDNELDNRAAHEAGMAVVIIITADAERFEGRCDYVIRDLARLRPILERLLAGESPATRPRPAARRSPREEG